MAFNHTPSYLAWTTTSFLTLSAVLTAQISGFTDIGGVNVVAALPTVWWIGFVLFMVSTRNNEEDERPTKGFVAFYLVLGVAMLFLLYHAVSG